MSAFVKLSYFLSLIFAPIAATTCIAAVDYPGTPPATATCEADKTQILLANDVIRCRWLLREGKAEALEITDRPTGKTLILRSGYMPRIILADNRVVDLASLTPSRPFNCEELKPDTPKSSRAENASAGHMLSARFVDSRSGLTIDWSAELRDDSNYVNQTLVLQTGRDVKIERIDFFDASVKNARQVGEVGGSVVFCDNIFLAVENPLAEN
ncbi:MAG: hypothetical protein JXM70_27485, partial [Pirellulales bacterium]|nr:hypothetical protein [Pirellulales bacterium]